MGVRAKRAVTFDTFVGLDCAKMYFVSATIEFPFSFRNSQTTRQVVFAGQKLMLTNFVLCMM